MGRLGKAARRAKLRRCVKIQHHLLHRFIMRLATQGGPKGGRPVVEERRGGALRGAFSHRFIMLFRIDSLCAYGAGRSMLRPYETPPFG